MSEKDTKEILFSLWEQLDTLPFRESSVVYDDESEPCDDYYDPFEGLGPREMRAIFWLALQMKMQDKLEKLVSILKRIRNGELLYRNVYLPKKDGGER